MNPALLRLPGGIDVARGAGVAQAALDPAGWWPGARRIASPNCDARPPDTLVDLIVVHAISLPPEQFGGGAIEALFTNQLDPAAHSYYAGIAHLRVSAHFLIRRDGEVIQFVPASLRAWHAGASQWQGRERCNDFSLGIELEGSDHQPFEPAQYVQLARLIRVLAETCPIANVVGHSDVSPGRKTDPGPHFDWRQLASALA